MSPTRTTDSVTYHQIEQIAGRLLYSLATFSIVSLLHTVQLILGNFACLKNDFKLMIQNAFVNECNPIRGGIY